MWQFALAFYAKEGRATKLLQAQQQHGLWINHYLSYAFARQQGLGLRPANARLLRMHSHWVKPARYWRMSCVGLPELYAKAKAVELELERQELVLWSLRLHQGHQKLSFWRHYPALRQSDLAIELDSWLL